jgi:hypothetical protein
VPYNDSLNLTIGATVRGFAQDIRRV